MTGHSLLKCLCCGSDDLQLVLDLGEQPPANSYSSSSSKVIDKYPLGLNLCKDCWHAQLTYCVDRHQLFKSYSYVSGTSGTLDRFFSWFTNALSRVVRPGARVLELAANDGSLIRHLEMAQFDCVGVDPAENIVEKARAEGLPIHCGYWPQFASHLDGKFDTIICMNVVAHVDNPFSFLVGCKQKLSADGIIFVQPSQARMFENNEFDAIYHEHLSFFNTKSMTTLAGRVGLKLVDSFLVKIHGDSPVYCLQHEEAAPYPSIKSQFQFGEFAINEDVPEYENIVGLFDIETYEKFSREAQKILIDLVKVVAEHRDNGFDIVFVGAAAKALTIINATGIKPTYFLDESLMKIGLYAPGCGSLIESVHVVSSLDKPALFVLSAWNFRYELSAKLRKIGIPNGSKFYAYFPKPDFI